MSPLLNFATGVMNHFIDSFILHIPEERRQEFREHLEDLLIKAIEAVSKGEAQGARDNGRV